MSVLLGFIIGFAGSLLALATAAAVWPWRWLPERFDWVALLACGLLNVSGWIVAVVLVK